MSELLSSADVHVGAVRGRYFRENFAQGGIDLVQIVPELVSKADAAIISAGRERGRIELAFGSPEAGFLERWREQMRALGAPALSEWRCEVRCSDDGVGVNASVVERRLGALGELPEHDGAQRGLFGRGLRDVWLAHGAGRIQGVRDGRRVESWFFPARGDDPYAYLHVTDEVAPGAAPGSSVTVPLAVERLPPDGRLRALVSQLVQLRPVLEDPQREVLLELPSGAIEVVRYPAPAPCPERPLLFDEDVQVTAQISARVTVRRAAAPLAAGMSRATRLGGLVIRSGRAAHESTFAALEGLPGTRHLYGEVRCDALERLQRDALTRPRPALLVKVDRSGLNENHPVVQALYAAIEKVLRPIVAEEERRAGAHLVRPGGALKARDQVGLRALNDALKGAFDTPGKAAFEPGSNPSQQPPAVPAEDGGEPSPREEPQPTDDAGERAPDPAEGVDGADAGGQQPDAAPQPQPELPPPLRFRQALVRLHPGERRGVSLLIDPEQIAPGRAVHVALDTGLSMNLHERWQCPPRSVGAGRGWVRRCAV